MDKRLAITDGAVEKIRTLLAGAIKGSGLRVKVVEGGCSGFEYKLEIDFPSAEDRVFVKNGVCVLLDPKSMVHLNGTELDYKGGLMQSGFVFNNPNVKASCGCGTSFSV